MLVSIVRNLLYRTRLTNLVHSTVSHEYFLFSDSVFSRYNSTPCTILLRGSSVRIYPIVLICSRLCLQPACKLQIEFQEERESTGRRVILENYRNRVPASQDANSVVSFLLQTAVRTVKCSAVQARWHGRRSVGFEGPRSSIPCHGPCMCRGKVAPSKRIPTDTMPFVGHASEPLQPRLGGGKTSLIPHLSNTTSRRFLNPSTPFDSSSGSLPLTSRADPNGTPSSNRFISSKSARSS